ncbi:MAG: ribonuclease HI family protein [Clostridia bacterium]
MAESYDFIVYSDGASRGNPGPAGYGAYVLDAKRQRTVELSGFLGIATNNVAEYEGLLAGLDYVRKHGGGRVLVRADSELMVRQLQGRYRVKSPGLIPLYQRAVGLLQECTAWRAEHVPREQNKDADRLANRGIDEAGPRREGSP